MNERWIYRALKYANDAKAVRRSIQTGSPKPVARRAARRVYGKVTGRLARRWFG